MNPRCVIHWYMAESRLSSVSETRDLSRNLTATLQCKIHCWYDILQYMIHCWYAILQCKIHCWYDILQCMIHCWYDILQCKIHCWYDILQCMIRFMVVLPTCGLSTPRIVQHGWTTLQIVHCNVYPPDRFDHHFSNGLTTNSHRLFRLISGGQTVSPQRSSGRNVRKSVSRGIRTHDHRDTNRPC